VVRRDSWHSAWLFYRRIGGNGESYVSIWLTGSTNDILEKQIREKDFECFDCEMGA
jgi:hypothetical protein